MYCSNCRGMATLLQQKNCMKTLSNGGVSGNSSNGTNVSTTGTTTLQQTRMLLPHEMIPQQQQNQTTQQTIQTFSHNAVNNVHQFSRYFSQYNNHESNTIYMPITTTATSTTISENNINSTNSHLFVTNSFSLNPAVQSTIAGIALPLPASSSSSTTTTPTTTSSSSSSSTISQNSTTYHQSNVGINKQIILSHQQSTSLNLNTDTSNSQFLNTETIEPTAIIDDNGTSNHDNGDYNKNGCQQNCNLDKKQDISELKLQSQSQQNEIISELINNGTVEDETEQEPEIDIVINNVVCSFSVRCHLNLREIALNGFNVEFRRENGMVTMKLRRPYTTASIWSSGRITCTGATSEEQAKIAARRYARCLQKLGFSVRFHNFRVVNVLGTCSMPWAIKIVNFSEKYKKDASYEPELHPGVTYKLKYPKATLKIFSTGSITVTAASVAHVQAAIEHIYPLVYEFRKKRNIEHTELLRSKQPLTHEDIFNEGEDEIHSPSAKRRKPLGIAENDPNEDIMNVSDFEADDPEEI